MWLREDIGKIADDILTLGQDLQNKLQTVRALTSERPDFSCVQDVPVLQAEMILLTRQRSQANNEAVALHLECMTLKAEIRRLKGYVAAAQNTGGLPRKEPPHYPDGRTAAAHDDTLFVSQEENDDEKTD